MILYYLAGRKIQYLGALGDVWSLATHSRRKVFLVKNSRNFVLICYSAQIPDIKWGETNGACIMWAKIPSSHFYARKAYFDPYPTSDLSVSVQTLKKYHAENRSFKKKKAPTSFCGILGTLLSKTVSANQLFGSQTVLCKFLFSLTHYIMLVLELHID